MSIYGQFCPVARTCELLGERWTILIVRELLVGSCRFNELQRGLSKISPTLLTKRLKELEEANIIYRKKISGQKGYEYYLTPAGKALEPMILEMIKWGMGWVEDQLSDSELDLELLMFDIQRNLDQNRFPGSTTTLKFFFTDADQFKDWWIVVSADKNDLCTKDPGPEPDVYITTCTRALTELWIGSMSWSAATGNNQVKVLGPPALVRQVPHWIGYSKVAQFGNPGDQA